MRRVRSFILPGGVIVLAAVVASLFDLPARLSSVLLPWYAFVPMGVGLLLGFRFGQGRVVCVLTALAAATWALTPSSLPAGIPDAAWTAAYGSAAVLLPLDIALLSPLRERGVLTAGGLLRLAFVVVQPFIAAGAYLFSPQALEAALAHRFTSAAVIGRLGVPQPSLAVFFFALVICGLGVVLRHGPVENGLFWALVPAFLAVAAGRRGAGMTFYLAVAGLVLAASIVEAAYGMAFRDRLTGLPSRRSLEDELERLRGRFAVAMVDVDHFKRFNDRHGHDVGDQVLRMVSSRLASVGGGGKAFRYGGEEFTVIFPGSSTEDAVPHLERLRKAIAASDFTVRGPNRPSRKPARPRKNGGTGAKVSVTVSIGAAWAEPGGAGAFAVIKAADNALLRAKKAGRNRVETWKGE